MHLPRLLIVGILLSLAVSGCSEPDRPTITLYLALQRGDIDQVERHIHWNADIEQIEPNGMRPLQHAAWLGEIVVVRMLLNKGANIDSVDKEGLSALQRALISGHVPVAKELRKRKAKLDANDTLLLVARRGSKDRDVIDWLVAQGADLSHKGKDGASALVVAVRAGNLHLSRHLLDAGADVNTRASDGRTVLQLAEDNGVAEIAQMLRRRGAR